MFMYHIQVPTRSPLRPVGYFSVIHRLISLTVGLRCWNLATGNPCFVIVDHEASVCEILGEILGHNYAKIKLLKSPPIASRRRPRAVLNIQDGLTGDDTIRRASVWWPNPFFGYRTLLKRWCAFSFITEGGLV